MKSLKIGKTTFTSKSFLAPMAGCADLPFRLIAREHGAEMAFYEMTDANALLNCQPESIRSLKRHYKDVPIAAQLLGSSPEQMCAAAHILLSYTTPVFLDINSACPVKKVLKKKAGAYLLTQPKILEGIVKTLLKYFSLPITVKLRIGFHTATKKCITDLAERCEGAGAAALFIHGRTMEQKYSGRVQYAFIRAAQEAVSIPVFGSGNIFSPRDAQKMFDETGCDGILVARGACGRPWIFSEITSFLNTGIMPAEKPFPERIVILKKHLAFIEKYNNYKPAGKVGHMRKVTQWYLTNFPHARSLRNTITAASSYDALLSLIRELET